MVVAITFSEDSRNRIGFLLAILFASLSLIGVAIICIGIFVNVHITNELLLLESYNSGLLPSFLISVGAIMFLLNGAAAKLAHNSGYASSREKFRMTLLPVIVTLFIFSWVVFSAAVTCLALRSSIEDALHGGLREAMKRYGGNRVVKVHLDNLQLRSRCCGSKSYKDWLNTDWTDIKYVDPQKHAVQISKKKSQNFVFLPNVPFSCCDVKAQRPCVTNGVNSRHGHAGLYNPEVPTLYMKGCTQQLMEDMQDRILSPVGSFVMIVFGVQMFSTLLFRYLQTSLQNAYEEGDPEGPGVGSLVPGICASCTTGDPQKYYKKGALDRNRGVPAHDTYDGLMEGGEDDHIYDEVGMGGFGGYGGGGGGMGGADMGEMGGGGGFGGGREKKRKSKKEKERRGKSKERSKSPKKSKDKKSKKQKSPKRSKKSKSKSPKKSKSPSKKSKKSSKKSSKKK